jgi:hypothetical protein
MTVWIVIHSEQFGGDDIRKVFASKEAAETFRDQERRRLHKDGEFHFDLNVEEWEVTP